MDTWIKWEVPRWWASDARTELPLAARALYLELLFHNQISGSLPSDHRQLALKCAVTSEEFARNWPKVSGRFEERDGRLYNKVATEAAMQRIENSDKKAEAGRLGGLAKASNRLASASAATASNQEKRREEKNISVSNETSPQTASPIRGRDVAFEEFWSIVWAKIGKGAAKRIWDRKVKTRELARQIVQAAKAQGPRLINHAAANGHSILHPATWLNAERWLDEEPKAPIEEQPTVWRPPSLD